MNTGSRKDVRLESWQENPVSKEPTAISDKVELWRIAIMRAEDESGSITFCIKIFLNSEEKFDWPVPPAAHTDLEKVFLHGGSYLRATMPHMSLQWNSIGTSYPGLHSIYVQEALQQSTPTGMPTSASRRWVRL
jgi:hypothetical protein